MKKAAMALLAFALGNSLFAIDGTATVTGGEVRFFGAAETMWLNGTELLGRVHDSIGFKQTLDKILRYMVSARGIAAPRQEGDRGIPEVILRQGLSCASSGRLSEPPAAVILSRAPSSFRQALEHQLLQLAHDTLALVRDEFQMSKAVHASNRGTDSGVSIQIRHLHA